MKRPLSTARQFNDGWCQFGSSCKFPHKCELCVWWSSWKAKVRQEQDWKELAALGKTDVLW